LRLFPDPPVLSVCSLIHFTHAYSVFFHSNLPMSELVSVPSGVHSPLSPSSFDLEAELRAMVGLDNETGVLMPNGIHVDDEEIAALEAEADAAHATGTPVAVPTSGKHSATSSLLAPPHTTPVSDISTVNANGPPHIPLTGRPPAVVISPAISPIPSIAAHAASAAAPPGGSAVTPVVDEDSTSHLQPPSILSLIASIQRLHTLNSHVRASLSHWNSAQSSLLLELEDRIQHIKYTENAVRLIREHVAASGGSFGIQQVAQGSISAMLGSALPLYTAYTSTSTISLAGLGSNSALYQSLLDPRRLQLNLPAKPFGYAQEVHYRNLIHLLRSKPSLLAFALSSFHWGQLQSDMQSSSALNANRKHMEQIAQCVVWDVFAQYIPSPANCDNGSGVGSSAVGGQPQSGISAPLNGSSEVSDTPHSRKVAYVTRMTARMMFEREMDRLRAEQSRRESAEGNDIPSSSTSTQLPLSLFDHNGFLPKLFHEFRLFIGGDWLRLILRDVVRIIIEQDENLDLSADLMSLLPAPGANMQQHQSNDTPNPSNNGMASPASFSDHSDIGSSRTGPRAFSPTYMNEEISLCKDGIGMRADPLLITLSRIPPSPSPPSISELASTSSSLGVLPAPLLHGRNTTSLFEVCTIILEKLEMHIDAIPISLRRLTRDMAKMSWNAANQSKSNQSMDFSLPLDELLPFDPNFELPTTRLLSDFFFLNWIVNALMFPEGYSIRNVSIGMDNTGLTDGFPVSPIAKRNLQAIGTVLIKLTSGSRFSSFSVAAAAAAAVAAAAAAKGDGTFTDSDSTPNPALSASNRPFNSTSVPPPSLPASRLDQFLQMHQPRVSAWLRRVIDLQQSESMDRAEERELEGYGDGSTVERVSLPAAWMQQPGKIQTDPSMDEWTSHSISLPATTPCPQLFLPNDLFALHGLLKGCWIQAVSLRVATTPSKRRNISISQQQTVPVPIAQLPLPAFPRCLREAVGATNSPCPFPLDVLTPLLSSLSSLGDVPSFVPLHDNVYHLLDGTSFPSSSSNHNSIGGQLAQLRNRWPWDSRPLKHAMDILLEAVATLPIATAVPVSVDMEQRNTDAGLISVFQQLSGGSSLSPRLDSSLSILRHVLPVGWKGETEDSRSDPSFRPFLLAVQATLLHEHQLLLHSTTAARDMLLQYGAVNLLRQTLAARELAVVSALRTIQLRRLFELTRPKVRRLKKFLAAKTTSTNNVGTTTITSVSGQQPILQPVALAVAQPAGSPMLQQYVSVSPHLSSPGINSVTSVSAASVASFIPTCSGSCPDSAAQDRFLCAGCSRLLERRRGLVKSFLVKYVVGEGIINLGVPPVAQNGNTNIFAPTADNTSTANNPNAPPTLISVGVGPPVDMRDPSPLAPSALVQDYILSACYPELFVPCITADSHFHSQLTKIGHMVQYDFIQFYVLMQVLDHVSDPFTALECWEKWRDGSTGRSDIQPLQPGGVMQLATQGVSDGEVNWEQVGVRLGLMGHPTVYIDLPEGNVRNNSDGLSSRESSNCSSSSIRRHSIRFPYVGTRPFLPAVALLHELDGETRPRGKLAIMSAVRSALLTTLAVSSFSELSDAIKRDNRTSAEEIEGETEPDETNSASTVPAFDASHSDAASIQQHLAGLSPFTPADSISSSSCDKSSGVHISSTLSEDISAGSVEDYMSALCFLLVVSAPPLLLSNLHFLRSLWPGPTGASKSAVDVLVACKYLINMHDASLAPAMAHREAQRIVKEQQAATEVALVQAKREQRMREEELLAQQARELSRQIQEAEEEQRMKLQIQQQQVMLYSQSHSTSSVLTTSTGAIPVSDATSHYQMLITESAGSSASVELFTASPAARPSSVGAPPDVATMPQ
jgi:hypothetical protein